MDTYYLTHRHCCQSEGVVITKVELIRKGQLHDIVDALDIAWLEPHLLKLLPVEGGVIIYILSHLTQTTTLQLAKLFAIHALYMFIPNHILSSSLFDCAVQRYEE